MTDSSASCSCCEGTQVVTPQPTANRPGLSALAYRVGTRAMFLETMRARLSSFDYPQLAGLKTRDPSDLAMALLDGWATVADVLTFYQERIANEGYLNTATERRSILELARMVGYTLRPGVSSSVYLAYTLDDKSEPVEIPAGARAQSIPGPGELPQSFETSEPLKAHAQWNNLKPRMTQPQHITFDKALTIKQIYFDGTTTNLKANDRLLLTFGKDADTLYVLRRVEKIDTQFVEQRTKVTLQNVPDVIVTVVPLVSNFLSDLTAKIKADGFGADLSAAQRAQAKLAEVRQDLLLGVGVLLLPPHELIKSIRDATASDNQILNDMLTAFDTNIEQAIKANSLLVPDGSVQVRGLTQLLEPLLKAPSLQPTNSLHLSQNLQQRFNVKSDFYPQLLVSFQPTLADTLYRAWANANVNRAESELQAVYAMRLAVPLFGYNAPKKFVTKTANGSPTPEDETPNGPILHAAPTSDGPLIPEEEPWKPAEAGDEKDRQLFLDNAYDGVLPGSFIVIQKPNGPWKAAHVESVLTGPRTAYNISGKTTVLTIAKEKWWEPDSEINFDIIRKTVVYAQSEALTLTEEPIEEDVKDGHIELGALYDGLQSGRWIIVSGERTDIPGTTGVRASELVMLAGVKQDFDSTLPGDKVHTTLILANEGLKYTYKRITVTIYGNVVNATHGETRHEALGSGDGSKALQSFTLKQPPLTYVSAATPAGTTSTLHVRVNDVEWHETDSLAGLGPNDRDFITRTDDDAKTTIVFGNGERGTRPPTGIENITSVYRNGIGKDGNVKAEQISLLVTRPLGVKAVINPLRASGGADKESRDQARRNAPLAVMALDRLVSTADYAAFARSFGGIGKASATRLSDGHRQLVYVTIAGADDIPIDENSDLYHNLCRALRGYGDPYLPIEVRTRELLALVISANVRVLPDYQWDSVAPNIRAALLDAFSFERRELGQSVFLSEVISMIQQVIGVAYVDMDVLQSFSETEITQPTLLKEKLDKLETAAKPEDYIRVELARVAKDKRILPAQLAYLMPDVPATLTLNEVTP